MSAYISMPSGLEWLMIMGMGTVFFLLPIALLVYLFIRLSPRGRYVLGCVLLVPIVVAALLISLTLRVERSTDSVPRMSTLETRVDVDRQLTSQSVRYSANNGAGGTTGGTAGGTFVGVGPPVLLILGLLIVAWARSGRTGRIVIGSLAGGGMLLLVLGVGAWLLAWQRPQRAHAPVAMSERYDIPSRSVYSSATQPTAESTVEPRHLAAAGFEPDVYASKDAAVRALTRLLAMDYRAHLRTMDDLPRTLVVTHTDRVTRLQPDTTPRESNLTGVAARTAKEFFEGVGPYAPVGVVFRGPPATQTAMITENSTVTLYLDATPAPEPGDSSDEKGFMEATIVGASGSYSRQAEYVNKPWNDNFDRWRREHPSTYWVMGQSEQLCPSREKALDQAMSDAARQAAATIAAQTSLGGGRTSDLSRQQAAELRQWLDVNLVMRVNDQLAGLKTDVFTQEFKRPYGSVWRSAVLVHVPPEKVKSFLDAYWAHAEAQRTTWLHTLLSAAGLFGVIVAVYLFLSMATRGYYVWSVRLATVVLAGVGVWCIVTFVR